MVRIQSENVLINLGAAVLLCGYGKAPDNDSPHEVIIRIGDEEVPFFISTDSRWAIEFSLGVSSAIGKTPTNAEDIASLKDGEKTDTLEHVAKRAHRVTVASERNKDKR